MAVRYLTESYQWFQLRCSRPPPRTTWLRRVGVGAGVEYRPPSARRSPWFKRRPIRTPSDSTAEAEQREFVLRVCEVLLTSLILELLASFRRRTGMRHP